MGSCIEGLEVYRKQCDLGERSFLGTNIGLGKTPSFYGPTLAVTLVALILSIDSLIV